MRYTLIIVLSKLLEVCINEQAKVHTCMHTHFEVSSNEKKKILMQQEKNYLQCYKMMFFERSILPKTKNNCLF